MSGTPTIVSRIHSRISGGGLNTLLPGGIWTRPIKREGNGATPTAFDADGDPLPAAVVVDGTDQQTPFGPDASFMSFPQIYIYAQPHDTGKATIAEAWDQMYGLLHKWRFATGNGTDAEVQVIGRLGVMDDEPGSDRILGGMRLQVTGLWRNTGG